MKAPTTTSPLIDEATFHADVQYIESLWRRFPVGDVDVPLIDVGEGEPLVFVPILEHLEWVYARQVRAFSQSRRVVMYRRQEYRSRFVGLAERAGELLRVLDSLGLQQVDVAATCHVERMRPRARQAPPLPSEREAAAADRAEQGDQDLP